MSRLIPQKPQEIMRYIEADKLLPEKYRFLLFDDKREVELVWNSKSNEVCKVADIFGNDTTTIIEVSAGNRK